MPPRLSFLFQSKGQTQQLGRFNRFLSQMAYVPARLEATMDMTINTASLFELQDLLSVDTVAVHDSSRKDSIAHWLRHDTVLAASVQNQPIGYIVLNQGFFHHAQVEMLMVASGFRGKGVGQRLLQEVEAVAHSPKLFITTNQSNDRMQRLLIRSGYRICGFIEELDPGDPELVFFKKLAG
jgi:ribosomal protein S18 acetylase RimI-like enzyme